MKDIEAVTLANETIRKEIRLSVERHSAELVGAEICRTIEKIPEQERARIVMSLLESEEKIRQARIDSENRSQAAHLEIEQKAANAAMDKDRLRTQVITNTRFILFLLTFPIVVFTGLTAFEHYGMACVMLFAWCGMATAIYFSKADALGELISKFTERR